MKSILFGERYLSKVGARFRSYEQARMAAERLTRKAGIDASAIQVVEPHDPSVDRKLEPETQGIARTLLKSHIVMGIVGLVFGLLAAVALTSTGVAAFSWSPLYVYGAGALFGTMIGLLIGAFISLRPDQDRVIAHVKEGSRAGRWFLVVQSKDHAEEKRVKETLHSMSGDVVASL